MSKTKKIAILAIIAMVLTMLPVSLFAATADDTRLAGADRIGTALEIASAGWSSADTVVLAPADQANLVDALAAAPLAGQEIAPILLTFKGSLDAGVKARIAALGANKVYVIGAISDAVKNEVDAIDGVAVEKLAGADRWATADAINAKLVDPAGTFVVGYNAIPDALSVASFAAANNYAIVLANADGSVDASKIVGDKTYLVGGTAVLKDYNGATRLGGADRYATNKAVFEGLSFGVSKVYVANGITCVDALAVAPLAAKTNAFVALASATDIAAAGVVNAKLAADSQVIAVGGTSAVSDAVAAKIGLELTDPVVCAVVAKDYDNDTKDQYMAFTVNGKTTTVDALSALGWDVEFSAGDSKSAPTGSETDLFADTTTGLLLDNITEKDYYVQLTLTKGSDIVISNVQKITVKNLNLVATGISDYELYVEGSDTKQNSTKLVTGEVGTFDVITVTNGSAKEDIEYSNIEFDVKSSDESVISVDGNEIIAQGPGTATITLGYGSAQKRVAFTVVNDAREADKIEVKNTSGGAAITSVKVLYEAASPTKAYYVAVLDQYGDVMDGRQPDATAGNLKIISSIGWATVDTKEKMTLTLDGGTGTTTVTFKDIDGQKLGTFNVTVSDNDDIAKYVFEMYKVDTDEKLTTVKGDLTGIDGGSDALTKDSFSTDTTLDVADDAWVVYQVKMLNPEGISIGNDDGISVSFTQSKSGVVATDLTSVDTATNVIFGKRVYVKALSAGTATLKVTNSYGTIHTVRLTVVNEGTSIKSISLKTPAASDYAKTYNYKSVLNTTGTGSDPIVNNVTLNKTAAQAIRLDVGQLAGTPSGGNHDTAIAIYIDKDSSGEWTATDTIVGWFEITKTSGIAGAGFTNSGDDLKTAIDDDGTIYFKVWSADGDDVDKVIAVKSVKVEL
jgi:putative cell wall-binding protein